MTRTRMQLKAQGATKKEITLKVEAMVSNYLEIDPEDLYQHADIEMEVSFDEADKVYLATAYVKVK